MSYDLRPRLLRGMDLLDAAADGILNGTMDRLDASNLATNAGRRFVGIATDIKARLAVPKIAAYEAKLIEGTSRPKITAAAE